MAYLFPCYMKRPFKAVWANKQNRHDRVLPQLWWDIKLHNIDPTPPHGLGSLSQAQPLSHITGCYSSCDWTSKEFKEFWNIQNIYKGTFSLRSIPCIFLHLYFYVNISHHKNKNLFTSGLEPPNFRLTAERANRLRHGDMYIEHYKTNAMLEKL